MKQVSVQNLFHTSCHDVCATYIQTSNLLFCFMGLGWRWHASPYFQYYCNNGSFGSLCHSRPLTPFSSALPIILPSYTNTYYFYRHRWPTSSSSHNTRLLETSHHRRRPLLFPWFATAYSNPLRSNIARSPSLPPRSNPLNYYLVLHQELRGGTIDIWSFTCLYIPLFYVSSCKSMNSFRSFVLLMYKFVYYYLLKIYPLFEL